jgi:hypothetical protein
MSIETDVKDFQQQAGVVPAMKYARRRKMLAIFGIPLAALIVLSPAVESSLDVIVGDVAITQTCWDRHGYNFIGRWSCRSALQRVGFIALGFSCGLNKGPSDFCDNLDKLSAENKQRKATAAHVDGRTP